MLLVESLMPGQLLESWAPEHKFPCLGEAPQIPEPGPRQPEGWPHQQISTEPRGAGLLQRGLSPGAQAAREQQRGNLNLGLWAAQGEPLRFESPQHTGCPVTDDQCNQGGFPSCASVS